jgi:hypothetical protein
MTAPPKPTVKLPKLPQLLERKLYKTGQTRGADDDVIYQNRVGRTSTVLIPYACWDICKVLPKGEKYEAGFIVLISPDDYFARKDIAAVLSSKGLKLGANALVFYETRDQWTEHPPEKLRWSPAARRLNPLGGQYVARVPGTTASADGDKIIRGFASTILKGAGIRVYEYASAAVIGKCRLQLEALFWLCRDAEEVAANNGMTPKDARTRKEAILSLAKDRDLLDVKRLQSSRIIGRSGKTICPLCLDELSSRGFFNRMAQATGRVVPDLTITELNLFHVRELRYGVLNHRPYNLGWGHHHCNVVVKDSGIDETLIWMKQVLQRNEDEGYLVERAKES